jgi:hypothetical protein
MNSPASRIANPAGRAGQTGSRSTRTTDRRRRRSRPGGRARGFEVGSRTLPPRAGSTRGPGSRATTRLARPRGLAALTPRCYHAAMLCATLPVAIRVTVRLLRSRSCHRGSRGTPRAIRWPLGRRRPTRMENARWRPLASASFLRRSPERRSRTHQLTARAKAATIVTLEYPSRRRVLRGGLSVQYRLHASAPRSHGGRRPVSLSHNTQHRATKHARG